MKRVISQDKKTIEGKLIKKKALNDSPLIGVDETFIGFYFDKPKLNHSFIFFPTDKLSALPLRTTRVTKIIDEFTFETINSIYYLVDKSTERNIKIEFLLN